MRSLTFSHWSDLRMVVICVDLGAFTIARAREFWICWSRLSWQFGSLLVLRAIGLVNLYSPLHESRKAFCWTAEVMITTCKLEKKRNSLNIYDVRICSPYRDRDLVKTSSPVKRNVAAGQADVSLVLAVKVYHGCHASLPSVSSARDNNAHLPVSVRHTERFYSVFSVGVVGFTCVDEASLQTVYTQQTPKKCKGINDNRLRKQYFRSL